MKLTPTMEKYVLHWGEMGTRWGVNRTVAQIHALLFLSERPLHAEEIMETLGVARSNVSNSLKELQSWGLVKVVHLRGDRRDHFEALKDVWEAFFAIADGRKRRELDPTLNVLRECVRESNEDTETPPDVKKRIEAVADFLELLLTWHSQMERLPRPLLLKILKLGAKVEKFLPKA